MEVIDFMCDGVCVCGDCMSVHLKGLWSVAIWWREKGERVYMFQQMSFALSVDSLGYIFPGADSPSFQGPELYWGFLMRIPS